MFSLEKARGQVFQAFDLADLEIPENFSLIGPLLLTRGSHAVLGGLTGIGKTFMLLNFARAFMTAEAPLDMPGWTAQKCRVLYIDKELGDIMLGQRLKVLMSDVDREMVGDRFRCMSKPPGLSLSNPDWVRFLRDYVAGEGIDILILDPISRFHYWDENGSGGSQIVEALSEITQERVSTLISHHFKKRPEGQYRKDHDPLDHYNFKGTVGTRLIEDASFTMTFDHYGYLKTARRDGYKAWAVKCRCSKARNTGDDPDADFVLHVNESNDRRVKFKGFGQAKMTPLLTAGSNGDFEFS